MASKPLPQIICLHGRGSNATILSFQARLISNRLGSIFEFIYLDGPFQGEAGPGILPWFEGMEPYFNWGRPSLGTSSSIPASTSLSPASQHEIDEEEKREFDAVNRAMNVVLEGKQASRVVGVLGFSQGTRVVAGLLRRQQILEEVALAKGDDKLNSGKERAKLRFGILVCGGGGLSFKPFELVPPEFQVKGGYAEKIRIPTVHVHGKEDEIAEKGKEQVESWFDESKARVLDVNAGHHFPREKEDVDAVCKDILEVWEMSRAMES